MVFLRGHLNPAPNAEGGLDAEAIIKLRDTLGVRTVSYNHIKVISQEVIRACVSLAVVQCGALLVPGLKAVTDDFGTWCALLAVDGAGVPALLDWAEQQEGEPLLTFVYSPVPYAIIDRRHLIQVRVHRGKLCIDLNLVHYKHQMITCHQSICSWRQLKPLEEALAWERFDRRLCASLDI